MQRIRADARAAFAHARDQLLRLRTDHESAVREFRPPRFEHFNWARDWFDRVAAGPTADRVALWVVDEDDADTRVTYAQMAARSMQLAGWLHSHGVRGGDRVLLMLGNQVELWETLLACIRIGAVVIPATTLLAASDVRDRIERGQVSHVVARSADVAAFTDVDGAA